MNNTEQIFPNLDSETVEQQYEIVKKMTTESHASIYGDLTYIYKEPISTFLGHGKQDEEVESTPVRQEIGHDALRSEDVLLDYLRRKRSASYDEEESRELDIQIRVGEKVPYQSIKKLIYGINVKLLFIRV